MNKLELGFFIAAFGVDGNLEGIEHQDFVKLSERWLVICGEYLEKYGASFEAPWSGNLERIQTKFTMASGAAIVTFSVNGRPVVSIALASGLDSTAENSVLKMFVNSLREVELVRATAKSQTPFQQVLEIKERPVMIVVPWADPDTREQDNVLVRELSIHMAGAFFLKAISGE